MTDKTLTNLSSLKIKENQKVNHGGDSKKKALFFMRRVNRWVLISQSDPIPNQ